MKHIILLYFANPRVMDDIPLEHDKVVKQNTMFGKVKFYTRVYNNRVNILNVNKFMMFYQNRQIDLQFYSVCNLKMLLHS